MRVCTTYGSPVPLRKGAEMHEVRLDVFKEVPPGLGPESVVTLCGKDPSLIPDWFEGLVDVGESDVLRGRRRIRSFHDFSRTPSSEEIVSMLSSGDQEISKGAFAAGSFADLCAILDASRALGRRHVLLGMGEIGMVTRIRQSVLGNEFTFGYEGEPTAPGQLSAEEMESLGDGCEIVGIAGHPLSHTKSPVMQEAAMRAAGINGRYLVFDSPDLDRFGDFVRGYGVRGVNVTIPYKRDVMDHVDSLSPTAEAVGAVNTVVNSGGRLEGFNTDVAGVVRTLDGCPLKEWKVLVMGSGGAARSAAYALSDSGSEVHVSGRSRDAVEGLCREFGAHAHSGGTEGFDLVVNCTPIGLVEGAYPSDVSSLRPEQSVFDMVYGRSTPLLELARSRGCPSKDGTDMLVAQGAESFRLWFWKDPDVSAMREAVL
ncbi:MAG: shikimate dehydrogenase [Candidatus Methanomethylophilaceae archaeon]|nr:shikimate dehydrogenase [Candidatus Methanomethylophilaceae archaeon]